VPVLSGYVVKGKGMRVRCCAVVVVLVLFGVGAAANAQFYQLVPQTPFPARGSVEDTAGHYSSVCVIKYLNSFTSYQFPNPFPPGQDPLSRLEFPIDQWFGELAVGYRAHWWSMHGQARVNLTRESARLMQDSDWDDETQPNQKTVFSESKCRLNRGLLVDVHLALAPEAFVVRPLIGYRYQYFYFTTHDGYQADIRGSAWDLPGDGIDFRQTFYHTYVGGVASTSIRRVPLFGAVPEMRVEARFDYGFVTAANEDLHLLRQGERITRENTRGHCWHLALTARLRMCERVALRLDGDFQRIMTTGDHALTNRAFGIDFSFDGSRVWSDQMSLSATAEFPF